MKCLNSFRFSVDAHETFSLDSGSLCETLTSPLTPTSCCVLAALNSNTIQQMASDKLRRVSAGD